MRARPAPPTPSFPAAHALQLVELSARWGVQAETLLAPHGLTVEALEQPDTRVELPVLVELTERARSLTGEPGLGVYLGLHKRLSAYGFVGFATMSASTLGEALEQAIEFGPAISTSARLSLTVEHGVAALALHEDADIGTIRDVALLSFFVGMRQMTRDLTGRDARSSVELAIAEPDYFARFSEVLPDVRFDQPLSRMLFNAGALSLPLPRPDRAALNLARQQCQAQLLRLGFDGSLPARVRRAMVEGDRFPTVDEVAARLRLSTRTLKRRLAEQGTTFSALLQQERQQRALHLLRASRLTMDEIADRLGYATASNFARSFRRWTGTTPAAYRGSRR